MAKKSKASGLSKAKSKGKKKYYFGKLNRIKISSVAVYAIKPV